MRIKSYFAPSVENAISQARLELGSEALLLNTRKVAEAEGVSRYEVVMGVPGARIAQNPPASLGSAADNTTAGPARPDGVQTALSRIREQISGMQELLVQMSQGQSRNDLSKNDLSRNDKASKTVPLPELPELHNRLLAAQIDAALSADLTARIENLLTAEEGKHRRKKPAAERLEKLLRGELEKRLRFRADVGVDNRSVGPVAVVVGPSGSGKTTSAAKLATALSASMPVRLLSLDFGRPGGLQHLQAFAGSPAIRRSSVKSLEALPRIIAELRGKECILIDTPGYIGNSPEAENLVRVLAKCPELDVHLVVPAYMGALDLRATIERYRAFQPVKLLVTKLDESQTFGAAVSEAARTGLALSFLADGPRVPDDIHPATLDAVMSTIGEQPRPRAAAITAGARQAA